jgi:hypothetical protein
MSDNEFRRALAQQRQDWEEEAEPAIKTHATKRIKVSNQLSSHDGSPELIHSI